MTTLTITDAIIIWVVIHVIDAVCWSAWRFSNFLADQYLRRDGWDEKDEWVPMSDYIPVWRLFKGLDDLQPKTFRRTF